MWRFRKQKSATLKPIDRGVYDKFNAILHPKQLQLFHEVLQYSLVSARSHFIKQISTNQTNEIIRSFEHTLDTLYIQLQQLNILLNEQGSWQQHSYVNLFLTIIVFYRVLLNPASEQQSYRNNQAVQRIPPKLFYLLGTEYWRLFELQTLLFGEMEQLRANADLLPLLTKLFPTHSSKESELANTQAAQQVMERQPDRNSLMLFTHWLEDNIVSKKKDYQFNESYVFVDTLRFDTQTVFVTHDCIKAFCQFYRDVNEISLYQILKTTSQSEKHYCLSHPAIDLFPIKTHLDVEHFDILKPVTILEKPHAD